MRTRVQRLNEAIKHLIAIGLIDGKSTTKSIATTMNRNSTNISSAIRGDERYLSRKFIRDFCATYKNIISEVWLQDGIGRMIADTQDAGIGIQIIAEESLMTLSKEELVFLIKQLIILHNEQAEMLRYNQERFNNITNLICKTMPQKN